MENIYEFVYYIIQPVYCEIMLHNVTPNNQGDSYAFSKIKFYVSCRLRHDMIGEFDIQWFSNFVIRLFTLFAISDKRNAIKSFVDRLLFLSISRILLA